MSKLKKTGLFFGSFNPVHIGHLIIANYLAEFGNLDQVWFIVSPQNPHKNKSTLLAEEHRLEMVSRAISDDSRLRASDVEFKMPKPSYTIHTLQYLSNKHPDCEFFLIMGADQLPLFHKWMNPELILDQYRILVYPRPGSEDHELLKHPGVMEVKAPLMEISSSFIRNAIKAGKDVQYFLHPAVWNYIREMNFYR